MRIFITGGTGFIGRAVVRALKGHEVLVLTRCPRKPYPECSYLTGDLFCGRYDSSVVSGFCPEAVIDLAWDGLPAMTLADNMENLNTHVEFYRVVKSHFKTVRRFIGIGSWFEFLMPVAQLANRAPEHGHAEKALFGAIKSSLNLIGSAMFDGTTIKFIWRQPSYVYGPGQRDSSLIPTIYRQLKSDDGLRLHTPDAVQDFVHVDQVGYHIAQNALGEESVGPICFGSMTKVSEVARMVNLTMGAASEPFVNQRYIDLFHGIRQTVAALEGVT